MSVLMKCPKCGGWKTRASNTRNRDDGSTTRDRTCVNCGYRFKTVERVMDRTEYKTEKRKGATKTATILNMEDYEEHTVSEVICVKCGKRWIAVRPSKTLLKQLECPECGLAGYAIETGQELGEKGGNNA